MWGGDDMHLAKNNCPVSFWAFFSVPSCGLEPALKNVFSLRPCLTFYLNLDVQHTVFSSEIRYTKMVRFSESQKIALWHTCERRRGARKWPLLREVLYERPPIYDPKEKFHLAQSCSIRFGNGIFARVTRPSHLYKSTIIATSGQEGMIFFSGIDSLRELKLNSSEVIVIRFGSGFKTS